MIFEWNFDNLFLNQLLFSPKIVMQDYKEGNASRFVSGLQ